MFILTYEDYDGGRDIMAVSEEIQPLMDEVKYDVKWVNYVAHKGTGTRFEAEIFDDDLEGVFVIKKVHVV